MVRAVPIIDCLIKVGGSVLNSAEATCALIPQLLDVSRQMRLALITGGGVTAKTIKRAQESRGLDFEKCWRCGILSLDLNAQYLSSFHSVLHVVQDVPQLEHEVECGHVPVLAPGNRILAGIDSFERTWDISTDSFGLYYASMLNARRYVIVTDVDGILTAAPENKNACLLEQVTADELERLSDNKVDAYFPKYLRDYPIECMIVNGNSSNEVFNAATGARFRGTRVV